MGTEEETECTLELQVLRLRMEILERQLELYKKSSPTCPKCGSHMVRNTCHTYCCQDFGYCGLWVLHGTPNKKARVHGSTFFSRTSYTDGQQDVIRCCEIPFRTYYFIGNKEVSKAEYYGIGETL